MPSSRLLARVNAVCSAFHDEECCPSCGAARPFTSRTDYASRQRYGRASAARCPVCVRAEADEKRRAAEREAALILSQVEATLQSKRTSGLRLEQLSLTEALYLLSVARSGGAEDLSYIFPLRAYKVQLSPTTDFDTDILRHLYQRGVLCVHPGSQQGTIVAKDTGYEFFIGKVHWVLPLGVTDISPARFVENVEKLVKSQVWPLEWYEEASRLHRTLALQECLQYLKAKLEDHTLELRAGEKTLIVLRSVLERFTIGQTMNFIWRAVRDAAAFYVRENTSRAHAANTVPGTVQRLAERAVADNWDVKSYGRDRSAPESALSQLLFTATLKLPEGGFATVPPSSDVEDRP